MKLSKLTCTTHVSGTRVSSIDSNDSDFESMIPPRNLALSLPSAIDGNQAPLPLQSPTTPRPLSIIDYIQAPLRPQPLKVPCQQTDSDATTRLLNKFSAKTLPVIAKWCLIFSILLFVSQKIVMSKKSWSTASIMSFQKRVECPSPPGTMAGPFHSMIMYDAFWSSMLLI